MKKSLFTVIAATGLSLIPAILLQPALAQSVVDLSPATNSQNVAPDTSIAGQFEAENGVEVDPDSVRILVNGRDVTSRSTITPDFFTYRPAQPFAPGAVQVQVEYRNTRGEQRTTAWTFTVQQPQPAVQITSVVHSAVSTSMATGENFVVTINGTPGAQASVLLVQDGRTVRELQAAEMSAGVYVATLTVQTGDRVNEGVVIGRLRRQNQTTYAAAAQSFSLNRTASNTGSTGTTRPNRPNQATTDTDDTNTNTSIPLQPRFTSPRDGDAVSSSGFTLVGQTRPNATVRIQVSTAISVLDVVNLGGQTLVDESVTANSDGEFRIEVPRTALPVPGTEYRVRATARSGNETSPETTMTLRQR